MRKVQIIPNYFVTADVRNRSSGGLVRFVALRKKSHRTGYFELTMIARFTTENVHLMLLPKSYCSCELLSFVQLISTFANRTSDR